MGRLNLWASAKWSQWEWVKRIFSRVRPCLAAICRMGPAESKDGSITAPFLVSVQPIRIALVWKGPEGNLCIYTNYLKSWFCAASDSH